MKKSATALAAFMIAASISPAFADFNDHGVDYCVHKLLEKKLAGQGIDITKPYTQRLFKMEEVMQVVEVCEGQRLTISPIFRKQKKEYVYVALERSGSEDSSRGSMTAVPKLIHLRR